MPLLRLISVKVITSLNVTVLSSQYDECLQSDCIIKNPCSEMKGKKRIHHGCEG